MPVHKQNGDPHFRSGMPVFLMLGLALGITLGLGWALVRFVLNP